LEFRRVQEVGGTCFMSLPKDWTQKVGVSKGSVLAVLETQNGCLTIYPRYDLQKSSEPAIVFPSTHLQREITGKYLLGTDTILIQGKGRLSSETSEIVRKTARRLVGLEIVEEDSGKILLQCLLDPSSFPPEKVLRREYLFAAGMHQDALTSLCEYDANLAKVVVERDDEVDRLYFLLVRLLRTQVLNPHLSDKMGIPLIDCLDYRLVATYVESIGDWAARLARHTIEFSKTRLPEEILTLLCQVGEASFQIHDTAMKAIFSKDLNLVSEVLQRNEKVRSFLKAFEISLSGKTPEIFAYSSSIATALENIADYGVDLADIVMPR